ncbi:unnamed protein product [Urochloa decumbens]|uniref:Uncharacterized protein n=1 Tax=Urochloa decumbens TaxID=240449 RepID=A0ABC8W1D0_9POAL
MEGLIPFIYRAVVQFKKEGQVSFTDLLFDEPSSPTSYFRLPGDSGRYQVSASDLFSRTAVDSGSAGAMRRSPVRCPMQRRRDRES